MSYNINVKSNGNYEPVQNIYIKHNGTYTEVKNVYVKENGIYQALRNYNTNIKYTADNITVTNTNTNGVALSNADVNKLKDLSQGTIIIRFNINTHRNEEALFSLGNNTLNNFNATIGYNSTMNKFIFWFRKHDTDAYTSSVVTIQTNTDYILGLQADSNYGYRLFLNGQIISEYPINSLTTRGYKFFNELKVPQDNQYIEDGLLGQICSAQRTGRQNMILDGTIKHINIYDIVLPIHDLKNLTTI